MDILSDFYLMLLQPPVATIFILLVGIALNLFSIWATDRFTDVQKTRENMEEIREWQTQFNEARKSMDPYLLEQVMAKQQRIMRLNADMMSARCKPYLIFIIPFFLIFSVLGGMYAYVPVAVIPFHVESVLFFLANWIGVTVRGGFGMFYWSWYMLTSMSLGAIMRKFAGQEVTLTG